MAAGRSVGHECLGALLVARPAFLGLKMILNLSMPACLVVLL